MIQINICWKEADMWSPKIGSQTKLNCKFGPKGDGDGDGDGVKVTWA